MKDTCLLYKIIASIEARRRRTSAAIPGLGWRLPRTTRTTPFRYHDGGLPRLDALFARFPFENAVVFILSNRDEEAGKVRRRVVRDFFRE